MKLNLKIAIVLCASVLINCASVKLSDSYKSNQFENIKNKKVLIIARSNENDTRQLYENNLVAKLKANNVNAVSALNVFPDLKENQNPSEAEKNAILKKFKNEGIETILLMALKDTKVTYVDNNLSSQSDPMTYNRGRYGISFVDYYNIHSIEYLSKDVTRYNRNENQNKIKEKPSYPTFILEAVIYDITLPNNDQLVGTFEVEAKEPKSAELVLNNFTKIISKQFK